MAKSIYSFCQLYFLWMVGLAFFIAYRIYFGLQLYSRAIDCTV